MGLGSQVFESFDFPLPDMGPFASNTGGGPRPGGVICAHAHQDVEAFSPEIAPLACPKFIEY